MPTIKSSKKVLQEDFYPFIKLNKQPSILSDKLALSKSPYNEIEVDELARTIGLGQWSRFESGHIDGVLIYEDSVIISNYF